MTIRAIEPADVPAVVAMVHELAAYERSPQGPPAGEANRSPRHSDPMDCQLTNAQLDAALFGSAPALFGHVAIRADEPVGFALWFVNFSTWRGVHGIYLEDLYVRPQARGTGVGRDLLATLAAVCAERGYERLEWWVLDWNPARRFYDSVGACAMSEWVPYRLAGPPLHELAALGPLAHMQAVES